MLVKAITLLLTFNSRVVTASSILVQNNVYLKQQASFLNAFHLKDLAGEILLFYSYILYNIKMQQYCKLIFEIIQR